MQGDYPGRKKKGRIRDCAEVTKEKKPKKKKKKRPHCFAGLGTKKKMRKDFEAAEVVKGSFLEIKRRRRRWKEKTVGTAKVHIAKANQAQKTNRGGRPRKKKDQDYGDRRAFGVSHQPPKKGGGRAGLKGRFLVQKSRQKGKKGGHSQASFGGIQAGRSLLSRSSGRWLSSFICVSPGAIRATSLEKNHRFDPLAIERNDATVAVLKKRLSGRVVKNKSAGHCRHQWIRTFGKSWLAWTPLLP